MASNNSLISGNFPNPLNTAAAYGSSLAFDNRSGEVYVADFDDSISVISDATNEVVNLFEPVATIQYLTSIVYDYKDNEIFVQYTGSPGTVAVVNAATNALVTTVTIGDVSEYNTNGLAYDSGLGEVFASNGLSSNVSVISTASNKVVAWVPLPDQVPQALAYDAGTHQVFVTNDAPAYLAYGNVSVISDATNALVKTIKVGLTPDALAYDSGKSEVFVGSDYNYGSLGDKSNVSVVDDTTDAVVTTVDLAIVPTAMVYDPAQNEVFVTSSNLTESVISDASNTVVATVHLDSGPSSAAYDSGKGEVWVLNGFPPYASAVSDASNTVMESVLLTFSSRYWAYDDAHQEEFLADTTSNTVAVVSDTTDHVVAMVPIPGEPEPYRVVYDSGKGEVFTSDNAGGFGLSVINDTTYAVVRTIPLPGVEPTGMAYDPAKGEIFVGNSPGNNVTIVSDTTDSIVGVIPNVGNDPWSLVYDRGKGEIFVANLGTGISAANVTVINDTTDTIVTSVNIGTNPLGEMVYDSGKGEIFVPNFGSDNVSVVSDATNQLVATIYTGTFAWGAAYDPTADEIFVGNFNGDFQNVTVISDVTDTTVGQVFPDGVTPSSLAFDPVTGDLYSADPSEGTVAIITPQSGSGSTHYPVTFTETGLPTGTSWSVTFNATLNTSVTSTIGFLAPDGSYTYSVGTVTGYVASPTGGPLTVSGGPKNVAIAFTPSGVPTYTVTFLERGLPTSTDWSVTLAGTPMSSTTVSLQFTEANGPYSFTVGAVTGYSASPSTGSVTVSGGPVTKDINFTASSSVPPPSSSSSGFLGLPGSDGYIVLGAIILVLVLLLLALLLRRRTYPVVFSETGLPQGTSWSVTLDAQTQTATGAEVAFHAQNGTHSFRVGLVKGYTATPGSGSVEVKSDRLVVALRFAPSVAAT